jgi:hypothetical protein
MNYDVSRSNFQPEASGDTLAMTHSQERMWFLHQLDPESPAYHVFGALDLNGPLDRNALDRAFDQIVSRHEILRSRHGMKNGRPEISIDDLRLASLDQRISTPLELEDALKNFAREPFDLADSPPLRACLFATGHHRHTLAICIHHIAADGFSMRVLVSELASFYSSYPLPPPQSGFLAYATRHRRWIESGAVDTQVAYWKSRLEGHPGLLAELGCEARIAVKGVPAPIQNTSRWVVERTNSWHNRGFQKLAVCTEKRIRVIEAFIALANAIIITRRLLREA